MIFEHVGKMKAVIYPPPKKKPASANGISAGDLLEYGVKQWKNEDIILKLVWKKCC